MYQTIKFGGKRISSSVDIVETVIFDYMNPHCDLQNSKPVFLHDTLAHDAASPYKVWVQKVQHLRRYRPDEHSLILHCDLDHKDSKPIFLEDNLAHDDALPYQKQQC